MFIFETKYISQSWYTQDRWIDIQLFASKLKNLTTGSTSKQCQLWTKHVRKIEILLYRDCLKNCAEFAVIWKKISFHRVNYCLLIGKNVKELPFTAQGNSTLSDYSVSSAKIKKDLLYEIFWLIKSLMWFFILF